jgi:hypothetical protein
MSTDELLEQQNDAEVTYAAAGQTLRNEYVASLRQLADILEENPKLKLPDLGQYDWSPIYFWDHEGADSAKASAARFSRVIPGKVEKDVAHGSFYLNGRVGSLYVRMCLARESICQKIVVGKETVTTRQLREELPSDAYHDVTEERDIVEWVCPDSLLGGSNE